MKKLLLTVLIFAAIVPLAAKAKNALSITCHYVCTQVDVGGRCIKWVEVCE